MSRRTQGAARPPRISLDDYPTPDDYAPYRKLPDALRPIKASENPCATCPGHCCELELSLTVHDVARLSVELMLNPLEFCHLQPATETWTSPPVEVDGAPYVLLLNSGGGKPCVFLHTVTSERRCAVYAQRPMTCRLYPFRWTQDGQPDGPKVIWCPTQWLVATAARRRITGLIRRSMVELDESARALRAFARQRRFPKTRDGLLRYVVVKGSAFLGLDPTPLLERGQRHSLKPRLW